MEPRVHGKITRIQMEAGYAANITSNIESFQTKDQSVQRLSRPIDVTFFCPNYEPSVKEADEVWIELECLGSWVNFSESASKEARIQPLTERQGDIEYSLTGEIFSVRFPNGISRLYIQTPVPILLTLALPKDLAKRPVVRDGTIMRLSSGRLYGDIETKSESA